MKTLLYTVAARQSFWEMSLLLASTLRLTEHNDDFIIFTDEDRQLPDSLSSKNIKIVNFLNLDTLPKELITKKFKRDSFHSSTSYPYAVCGLRFLLPLYYKPFLNYEKIGYFDADIVLLKNLWHQPFFLFTDGLSACFDKKRMRKHKGFQNPKSSIAISGFNSGFFLLTTNRLNFLTQWKESFFTYKNRDQTEFNRTIYFPNNYIPFFCSTEMGFRNSDKTIWHYTLAGNDFLIKELKVRNLWDETITSNIPTFFIDKTVFKTKKIQGTL